MVVLAVALGIGRFAFTPLLPLMLHGGGLDIRHGGWLASCNYAGYFAGNVNVTGNAELIARWPELVRVRWS